MKKLFLFETFLYTSHDLNNIHSKSCMPNNFERLFHPLKPPLSTYKKIRVSSFFIFNNIFQAETNRRRTVVTVSL